MSSDGRYDVIIIGSGAGGGTLARHLAPSGKRILILERGDWLPRETRELGLERGLRRQPLRTQGDVVRRQGQAVPAGHPLRGRRGDQDVRGGAVSPSTRGFRRAPAPRRDLAGVAHLVRRHGAVLHQGRAAVRGPRQPRRGRDGGPRERPVPVPSADPRAAHPAAVRRPGAGRLPPVPRPVRRAPARGRPSQQPVHPVPDVRRVPVPRPGQVRCRDAGRPAGPRTPECQPPDAGRRHPPRDERGRDRCRAGRRRARRGGRDLRRRHGRRVSPERPTRPRSCWRRPTIVIRTGSPTDPARSAGTTCSTTAWRSWRSPRNRTRRCSRRRSG